MSLLKIRKNGEIVKFMVSDNGVTCDKFAYPNIIKWVRLVREGKAEVLHCSHVKGLDGFAEEFNDRLMFKFIMQEKSNSAIFGELYKRV